MRSKEEFDLGGVGIDTKFERDHVNYKPNIKYEPDREGRGTADPVEGPSAEEIPFIKTPVLDAWNDVENVKEEIEELVELLEEKLKDMKVVLPHDKRVSLIRAGEFLGFDISEGITIQAYKATFVKDPRPEHELIQTVFETYAADVTGNINAELYRDVLEMQQDWEHLDDFIFKGMLGQLLNREERSDRTQIEMILKREEEAASEAHRALLRLHKVNREIYARMMKQDATSEAYFDAVTQYDVTERERLYEEKRIFTRMETAEVVSSKTFDAEDTLGYIRSAIDHNPYENEDNMMLYYILKQFESKEEALQKLLRMRIMLKLSVDSKIRDSESENQKLRQRSGLQSKERIQNALINDIHMRNEVSVDMFDMMSNMNGIPLEGNFEVLLNHMGAGLEESEKLYTMHLQDFYRVHSMDDSLRSERLNKVVDKDITRETYKMINGIIEYIQTDTTTWPKPAELSKWIEAYMSQ